MRKREIATKGRGEQSGFCSVLTIFRYLYFARRRSRSLAKSTYYDDDDVDDDRDNDDDDDDVTWNVMTLWPLSDLILRVLILMVFITQTLFDSVVRCVHKSLGSQQRS